MPASVPKDSIWLWTRPADMRKSFDGLAGFVRRRNCRPPIVRSRISLWQRMRKAHFGAWRATLLFKLACARGRRGGR